MSMTVAHIEVPEAKIAALCRRNGIRKLALFGSVLTDRFSDDSDIDVLVEFLSKYLGSVSKLNPRYWKWSYQLGYLIMTRTLGFTALAGLTTRLRPTSSIRARR